MGIGLEPRTARFEVQVLGEELGIEPEQETGALFEEIKVGRIAKGAGVFHGTR